MDNARVTELITDFTYMMQCSKQRVERSKVEEDTDAVSLYLSSMNAYHYCLQMLVYSANISIADVEAAKAKGMEMAKGFFAVA